MGIPNNIKRIWESTISIIKTILTTLIGVTGTSITILIKIISLTFAIIATSIMVIGIGIGSLLLVSTKEISYKEL